MGFRGKRGRRSPMASGPLLVTPSVHGGIDAGELTALGLDPGDVLDFSSNQSPLGASPRVRKAVAQAVLDAYPDREGAALASRLAARHGLPCSQVVVGNGSTELIRLLAQIVPRPGDTVVSLGPSFGEYRVATQLARATLTEFRLDLTNEGFDYNHVRFCTDLEELRPSLCWLCSPHNPTGLALSSAAVEELVSAFPHTVFVLDEAYVDLLTYPQWTPALLARGNLVVLRSMTKTWGLAGLRLGYALADESLALPLRAAKAPWSVNACALAAGEAVLDEEEATEAPGGTHWVPQVQRPAEAARPREGRSASWYGRAVETLAAGKEQLVSGLRRQGWKVLPSSAGFFLVEVGDAACVRQFLLKQGCLVRDCTSFGLPAHVRVSPRLPDDNERLISAFANLASVTSSLRPGLAGPATDERGSL